MVARKRLERGFSTADYPQSIILKRSDSQLFRSSRLSKYASPLDSLSNAPSSWASKHCSRIGPKLGPGWSPRSTKWRPSTMGLGSESLTFNSSARSSNHGPSGKSSCRGGRPSISALATRTSRSIRLTWRASRRIAPSPARSL